MGAGPRFTPAARLAAAAKRRERSDLAALNFHEPCVFALRAPSPDKGYVWEVRKFGGVSLRRSDDVYISAADARRAGMDALTAMKFENA